MTGKVTKNGYMFILPWGLDKVGGVNQVVKSLLQEITAQDELNTYLFINSWNDKGVITSNENNVTTFKSRLRRLGANCLSLKEQLSFFAYLPFEISKLLKVINKNKISIVNAHYPELNLIIFAIIKFLFKNKFKFILSFHGTDVKAIKNQSNFSKLQWRFILYTADKVVPCSDNLSKKLIHLFPKVNQKTQVIHNGINSNEIYQKLSNGFSVYTHNKPYFICIGSLDENKGHNNLINAYSQLPDAIKDEVNLVIIGKDTPYSKVLESIIQDLNLQNNVFIYKNIPHQDTIKTLSNALFLALTSHNEGYPLVFLEAGLMKKAVIATDVGGISELIKNNDTGLLIKDNEIQLVIEAITKLVDNSNDIRDKLADNLHKKVVTQSWSTVYQSYLTSH